MQAQCPLSALAKIDQIEQIGKDIGWRKPVAVGAKDATCRRNSTVDSTDCGTNASFGFAEAIVA
jgi:hypothetical protein